MDDACVVAITLKSHNFLEIWHSRILPRVETHKILFLPTSHYCPNQLEHQLLIRGEVAFHFVVFYNPAIRVAVFELLYAIPNWQASTLWGVCLTCQQLVD